MIDMNSSELLLEAQLADRRRELIATRRSYPAPARRFPDLRAALAGALAHLAFHIDRRSVGAVAARRPHVASRS